MPNMTLTKVPMPAQEPDVRNKNFEEVALGYTEEMAMEEATRCINCKNKPCMSGCPVCVRIPEFIEKVAAGEFEEAYKIITSTNGLPAVCGRVCPQENQCEGKCIRGIKGEPVAIGRLERFVADYHMAHSNDDAVKPESNGIKVAVIGAGPAGLTCAGDLAKLGYEVTIFEAFHKAGGVLVYGIPEFRLPKAIVQKEVDNLTKLGVKIETNMVIGRVLSIDEIMEMGFKAVFIGSGAGLPSFMGIEGEALIGVYSANEYLTRANLMKAYLDDYDTPFIRSKNVAVVGGGNVAMDAARTALRLGAENVYIVYRRGMEELPARNEEIEHAEEEGIIFKTLHNPVKLIGDEQGRVTKMECVQMELASRMLPDVVVLLKFLTAILNWMWTRSLCPSELLQTHCFEQPQKGLEANKWGCLVVNEDTLETTRENVYAGGDAVTGAATVILAMGAGKQLLQAFTKN